VKNGQPATVTVAAIGDSIGGSVARISPTPTASTSTSNNVVSYPVTVTLQNPPAAVRSGMSADISITIAAAQSVLAVPTTALVGSDGQYAVRVPTETGTPEVKPVTVGLVTNAMAEIRSGLSEGDLVITGTASQSQTTAAPGGFGGGVGIPFGGGGFQRNGGNGARGGNGGNGARGGNGG
jgi:multidrug efflux pump subunit AcrA (membrane-fusion protein)